MHARRLAAPVLALSAAFTLAACGGASLSDNDAQACQAAQDGDAEGVYALQSVIDNEDLKKNADRIKIGTSNEADDAAMAAMLAICTDLGFAPTVE